jgi:hypothetical protein
MSDDAVRIFDEGSIKVWVLDDDTFEIDIAPETAPAAGVLINRDQVISLACAVLDHVLPDALPDWERELLNRKWRKQEGRS